MNKAERIPVDRIVLDNSNPRIKHYLEMYTVLNEEHMLLALGAGSEDEGGSTALGSFERLKHSIRASGGIIQSIIVKPLQEGRFLCIEGNTRVAIYRQLRNEDKALGQSGDRWNYIPALVNDQMDEEAAHKIRLQVHLVGNRPWDAYSKAKYLHELVGDYKMPLGELVSYCGGSRNDVLQSINAYLDMENHYRPVIDGIDGDFDPSRFSAFVELQKPGIKQAIYKAGFSEGDFNKWVDERKLFPLASVRRLPQILDNPGSKRVFLREGARAAINTLDAPDLDTRLREANISQLARALQEKIGLLPFDDAERIAGQPASEEHLELKDLLMSLGDLLGIETNPSS
ncbi:MAG: ParB N-terminal domain-containing protein [Chloroflexi bacterium]|nr:ParB N-terminal domain-containing protein [Chloroflexota bacterium]